MRFPAEKVVREGDAYTGGPEPVVAVLTPLERGGIAVPLIIVLLLVVVGVDGAQPLIGVLACAEESDLQTELQAPPAVVAQGQHVARADACADALTLVAVGGVDTDTIYKGVDVGRHVPVAKGRTLADGTPADVATLEVVTALKLVVAHLHIFMGVVVLPPGEVQRGTEGEMTVQRIVFHGNIRDRTEPVVSRGDVSEVEEHIGLHAEQLPVGQRPTAER